MYIPMVEIPGCQPDDQSDNQEGEQVLDASAPRETVTLRFGSLPDYEVAAEFYSYIAYPDPLDATQRTKYSIALSRWAILARGKIDKEWNESADEVIRPIIFSQPEKLYWRTYTRGSDRWWRRGKYAAMMLMPDKLDELFGGLAPTVGNVAGLLGAQLGYSEGSQKTIESRIWAPTKPVVHAAAAVMYCLANLKDPDHEWDNEHQLCYQQPFLATLFYPDVFQSILMHLTNLLYLQAPTCRRFKIRERDMINFAWER